MAFTASTVVQGVSVGNQLMKILNVTADAATGTVDTGMKLIAAAIVSAKSGATMPNVMENSTASGAVSNGVIALSNCTSGNVYRVTLLGA